MATRSRRSAAGTECGLNPATIHFLDIGRLRRELETRGLDTKGSKTVLADRLYEAVSNTINHISFDNSPTKIVAPAEKSPPKKVVKSPMKKAAKRKSEVG